MSATLHSPVAYTNIAWLLEWACYREPDKVFASLDPKPSQATWSQLMGTIAHRLTPQPVKLRADVELTCTTEAGIEAIKRALLAGEACGSDEVPIKARLVAPPLYVLGTNATNKVGTLFCFGNRRRVRVRGD